MTVPARVDPDHFALLRAAASDLTDALAHREACRQALADAERAVLRAEGASAFTDRHVASLYGLGPGDRVLPDGRIIRRE